MELGRDIHVIPKIRGADTYLVLGETQVRGGPPILTDASKKVKEFAASLG